MNTPRNIQLNSVLEETAFVKKNPVLTVILLKIFLAIKYNIPAGRINIRMEKGVPDINNTALAQGLDASWLFRRFGKPGHAKDGIGPGLAIIRQIVSVSGFGVSYLYEDQLHHFILMENNH
ncbi:MAG: hypothetical protein ABJB86_20075 [Bacteroidota bacterium]